MEFGRDLLRGSLDLMVLSVLAEESLYGYLIQQRLREASGNMVRIQAGTLYPILHRLEASGAIRSCWDATTGRDRKWYEITAKGRRLLQHEADEWHRYVDCVRKLLKSPRAESDLPGSAETMPT
jgi:PadR family transcriptional regulator, regulatory protein PadR